jgi:hypothetical protein
VCCDGATRQHWGSSALKGGQAYIEATNDAIKNVAVIFCRTGRANLKHSDDSATQLEKASSLSSSKMSPLAIRMMRSSSQEALKTTSEISPPQSDSTESVCSREGKSSSGYSCLLVDDDKINTRSLIHVLKNPRP